jgi:hypothetical protein
MICILTNWGDDEFLKSPSEDDLKAIKIHRFRRAYTKGYSYTKDYYVEDVLSVDRFPKNVCIHCRSRGFVLDMFAIFYVIAEAVILFGYTATHKHKFIRTGRNSVFKMVFFSLFFCDFVGTREYSFAQIHRYADKICLK